MTFDQAQDAFRVRPGTIAAQRYSKVAREYRADDMIGDDTLTAALREVDAFFVARDSQ